MYWLRITTPTSGRVRRSARRSPARTPAAVPPMTRPRLCQHPRPRRRRLRAVVAVWVERSGGERRDLALHRLHEVEPALPPDGAGTGGHAGFTSWRPPRLLNAAHHWPGQDSLTVRRPSSP